MVTIIRVTAKRKEDLPALELIGAEMNQVRPGVFTGLRRRGDGFACEISTSADWMDHERSALDFVIQFSQQLAQARHLGAVVTVDMALDSVDFQKPIEGVHFRAEVLRALGEREVALEVTIYTGLSFGPSLSTPDSNSD